MTVEPNQQEGRMSLGPVSKNVLVYLCLHSVRLPQGVLRQEPCFLRKNVAFKYTLQSRKILKFYLTSIVEKNSINLKKGKMEDSSKQRFFF